MSHSPNNQVNPIAGDEIVEPATPQETGENKVTQMVNRLIRAKRITYPQYQALYKMVLADGTIDEQERRQINRLFDAIQSGGIRIVE
ncbi:hypothetical protein [Leptothoe sp. PORK10 BA2]|uniref:hypothetical protein n=1 Tax=Leptothoe sp. PORK10 BA2 TaxID=3110254 RepID=UPI002B1F37EF|nr:hypothetical protein [Leptothoe sp. PORK10 BA2]MEA5466719.1 hypothetical protein [Leptothoe sp. PORK10 BA2]